LMRRNYIQKVL